MSKQQPILTEKLAAQTLTGCYKNLESLDTDLQQAFGVLYGILRSDKKLSQILLDVDNWRVSNMRFANFRIHQVLSDLEMFCYLPEYEYPAVPPYESKKLIFAIKQAYENGSDCKRYLQPYYEPDARNPDR